LIPIAAAIVVAAAILWAGRALVAELRAARTEATRTRALAVLQAFSAGIAAAHSDPRALITWVPLARAARQLLPAEFALLDAAAGGAFPFSAERIQAAHAQWTAEWLAWERAHDAEYKLKAAVLDRELAAGESAMVRARLEAVEREKLDLYQRRYQEYVQIAKALQSLA
jgi:hypothetical protein